MYIDRDRFMDQGYLIIRDHIAPDQLQRLRAAYETILDRQRAMWAADRGPDDPPGGLWDWHCQPRLDLLTPGLVDKETTAAVEVWVEERTLEISSRLMALPEVSVNEMVMLCSPPLKDFGPSTWHRDMDSVHMGPLQQLVDDLVENGPRGVQWQFPLHDDSVFWIVPGSHRRPDADLGCIESINHLRTPLEGSIPMPLRAGDALVYHANLVHRGSNYSRTLRRTLFGGHSMFTSFHDAPFLPHLRAREQAHFAAAEVRTRRAEGLTELALRAVLNGDERAYGAALESLQPGIGDRGKLMLSIYLDKIANGILHQHRRDIPEHDWHGHFIGRVHPISLRWGREFNGRFTPQEAESLWERFQTFDTALRNPKLPGLHQQGYAFAEVPGLPWNIAAGGRGLAMATA